MKTKKDEVEEEIKIPETQVDAGDVPPEGITSEEWSDLSPTEREGILSKEEDDENPEVAEEEDLDPETLKIIAGIKEEVVVKVPEKTGEVVKEEEIVKPLIPVTPVTLSEGKISDEDLLNFRPAIDESKLIISDSVPETIQAKFNELEIKFDEGELERKDYNSQRDALNRQITLNSFAAREAQKANLVWEEEQRAFLKAKPEYLGQVQEDGKFNSTLESSVMYGALGKAIDLLNSEPANSRLTGMQILLKADGVVKKMFKQEGSGVQKPEINPEVKKMEADPRKEKPAAPLPDNKTLSGIPQAGTNSTDDAWSQLDKLTGAAYERALEKLTPEQKEAYERRV